MARQLRLELVGGLYHVTSRGDRRENIYEDDEDRLKWLDILGHTCKRYKWRCHAYCLMDNHYHFVIETAEANLSKGMRHLNGVYTQYYNRRHGRIGHVFQGRFKGILVEQDEYLQELSRYVVLNPLRAGMVKDIIDYKWSSYGAVIGVSDAQPWLEVNWILKQFSKQRKRAVEKYINFVREGAGLPSIWGSLQNQIFLGSDKFINKHQNKIKAKDTLNEIPLIQKRKIPKSLKYYSKKYKDQNKSILNAYLSGGYTLKEIGDYFGKHYSTVSRIVRDDE